MACAAYAQRDEPPSCWLEMLREGQRTLNRGRVPEAEQAGGEFRGIRVDVGGCVRRTRLVRPACGGGIRPKRALSRACTSMRACHPGAKRASGRLAQCQLHPVQ